MLILGPEKVGDLPRDTGQIEGLRCLNAGHGGVDVASSSQFLNKASVCFSGAKKSGWIERGRVQGMGAALNATGLDGLSQHTRGRGRKKHQSKSQTVSG